MRFFLACAVLLAGCSPTPTAKVTLSATRVALSTSEAGTAMALGMLRLPTGFAAPADRQVTLRSIESVDDFSAKVTLAADGSFRVSDLPVDAPLIVEAATTYNGASAPLRAVLKPISGVNCCRMDVASTAIADKLTSETPWVTPPANAAAPATETMDPTKVGNVQTQVQDRLNDGAAGSPQQQAQAVAGGGAGGLFDTVVANTPGLGDTYDAALAGGDASLTVHIASVGPNTARVPGVGSHRSFGVFHLTVPTVPAGLTQVEFYLNAKEVAQATAATSWQATLDTWKYADGGYTLTSIGVWGDGSRSTLDRTYMDIVNNASTYCPAN